METLRNILRIIWALVGSLGTALGGAVIGAICAFILSLIIFITSILSRTLNGEYIAYKASTIPSVNFAWEWFWWLLPVLVISGGVIGLLRGLRDNIE